MRQAQRKMSERKARRKRMALAVILLGHRVKSPVTVIFLDGALSVSILFVNRYICSSGSRPAHKSRFFYVIGNIVPYNVKPPRDRTAAEWTHAADAFFAGRFLEENRLQQK